MNRDQKIGAAMLAGAAVLGWAAYRSYRGARKDCTTLANSAGNDIARPCGTVGPDILGIEVCTPGDYASWKARLGMQAAAIVSLQGILESLGLLSSDIEESIAAYYALASPILEDENAVVSVFHGRGDIEDVTAIIQHGCQLLNAGNAKLAESGHADKQVSETPATELYEERARESSQVGVFLPVVTLGLVVGGAYYFGWFNRQ